MNKTLLIALVGALMLGGCSLTGNTNTGTNSQNPTGQTTVGGETNGTQTGEWSLKDVLARGESQKCTYSWTDDNGAYSGTMYSMGKKFKQEINTKVTGSEKEIKMNTVSDGENVYIWNSDMGGKGIKMSLSEAESGDYSTQGGKVDLDKKYKFDCNKAAVNESDLTPPKDVEFQDFAAQLKDLQNLQKQFEGIQTGN